MEGAVASPAATVLCATRTSSSGVHGSQVVICRQCDVSFESNACPRSTAHSSTAMGRATASQSIPPPRAMRTLTHSLSKVILV